MDNTIKGISLQSYESAFYERLKQSIGLNSKRILEIGCGTGNLTRFLALRHIDSTVIGIDEYLDSWWNIKENSSDTNWRVLKANGTCLPFSDSSFDIVISVASFEHIDKPVECLSEILRVLKPCGDFVTDFGPIWTCAIGHHYNHWIEEDVMKILPWSHLYMTYDEMYEHLIKFADIFDERAKRICEYIYNSPMINRIGIHEHRKNFVNAGMEIIEWQDITLCNRLTWVNGKCENELTEEIYKKLDGEYSKEDLYVAGLRLHLKKPNLLVSFEDEQSLCGDCESKKELRRIYNSRGWRLLKKLYRIKDILLPQGSLRYRIVRKIFRSICFVNKY